MNKRNRVVAIGLPDGPWLVRRPRAKPRTRAKRVSKGLRLAIKACGSKEELARRLGITGQSIQQWFDIPRARIITVEKVTGVPRALLAPDLFAPKRDFEPYQR